ncbi:hypothetical protein [Thalassotalea sp. ND16A]|uniref:hypothetical protein n=1 Tax=Thalassotalea sp. ND16A TaxID=1535422 RepID=UPI0013628081|nr:hypothetical protein [Thalassotalea sp. ND16A]
MDRESLAGGGSFTRTLKAENGNWAAAARRLSTDRANLNRIAKRLDIKIIKSVVD